MDGENNHDNNATPYQLGLDADEPIPPCETNEPLPPGAPTTEGRLTRQQRLPHARTIVGQRNQTSDPYQAPSLHRRSWNNRSTNNYQTPNYDQTRRTFEAPITYREPRGSDPSYASYLSDFLGPIRRPGEAPRPEPARISSSNLIPRPHLRAVDSSDMQSPHVASQARSTSRYIQAPAGLGNGRLPAPIHLASSQRAYRRAPSENPQALRRLAPRRALNDPRQPYQQPQSTSFPASRSYSAPFPPPKPMSNPVVYNPLTEAMSPVNALRYPIQPPHDLLERIQRRSSLPVIGNGSQVAQSSNHRPFIAAQNSLENELGDFTMASQAIGDSTTEESSGTGGGIRGIHQTSRRRGRPLDSKVDATDTSVIQPLPARTILSHPSGGVPLPSYTVPVALPTISPPRPKATFSLSKNASLMVSPYTKTVPATLRLVADNGDLWEYKYPGTRRNWKKTKIHVSKLNHWNNTLLHRKLPEWFPAPQSKRSSSAPLGPRADKWTEWERASLEAHIIDAVKEKKGDLGEEEWQKVADLQNEEFFEHKRLPGLPLAESTSRSLTINSVPVTRGGGHTQTEGCFPERTSAEIQSILYSWPSIHEKVRQLIKQHRGKVPSYLDCDTDLSDSDTSLDVQNEGNTTIMVGNDAMQLAGAVE